MVSCRSIATETVPETTCEFGILTISEAATSGRSTHRPVEGWKTKSSQPVCRPQMLQHSSRLAARLSVYPTGVFT